MGALCHGVWGYFEGAGAIGVGIERLTVATEQSIKDQCAVRDLAICIGSGAGTRYSVD